MCRNGGQYDWGAKTSDYIEQNKISVSFAEDENWIILSSIEQSIKTKIELVGVPLKEWDISINYGIKTGFNEAFIIDNEKRTEILENCQTEDERARTADLIRPYMHIFLNYMVCLPCPDAY